MDASGALPIHRILEASSRDFVLPRLFEVESYTASLVNKERAAMSINSIEVVIFSFNRGRLLLNCLDSVRRYVPGVPVTVFDDASTDPETCAILRDVSRKGWARVLVAASPPKGRSPRSDGGFNANIQSFVDVHAIRPYALILQDDLQVVRPLECRDIEGLDKVFFDFPQAVFVSPLFLYSTLTQYVDMESVKGDSLTFSLLYDYEYSGFFHVCIAHINRLRSANWKFVDELVASLAAREAFGTMPFLRHPFVAHVPSPPTFRYRRKTLVHSIWERYRAGLYPIDPLTDSDVQRLFSLRDTFPTAESFLTSRSFWGAHPWPYVQMDGAPASVRALHRIEEGLRLRLGRSAEWLSHKVRRTIG